VGDGRGFGVVGESMGVGFAMMQKMTLEGLGVE
jgi:hypothetical protein